ncbi:MAG: DNA replication/repair protein RecF [Ignavibacteriae bacterium]|nr:DNA replication/repair protein RecF [Ignavibacteriota bacterium]
MNVVRIHLENFRNHENTTIDFGEGINVLLGNNGQGKTNVLEAVSYLSLTKSFYAASDGTVLQIGKNTFEVEGTIQTDANIQHTVRAAYNREGEKQFTVNGNKPDTLASVIGRFPIVVLSPENNAITFGGPAERRRFADLLLSQISRSYLEDSIEYRRVLRQRNKLLLDAKIDRVYSPDIVEPWSSSLIQLGSRIIWHRKQFVEEFQIYVLRAYKDLVQNSSYTSSDREEPLLRYDSLAGVEHVKSIEEVAGLMREELRSKQFDERKRGTSLVGPHRDDMKLMINGISVQQYASQGQHKTMLVALKIAEFFYLKERRNEAPLFLLDDVFSELDDHRSRLLLSTVASLGQTIITTTDEAVFHNAVAWNGMNRKFWIEAGAVNPA